MASSWTNGDGLKIVYGPTAGTAVTSGQYMDPASGTLTVVELTITLTDLATGAAVLNDNLVIPKGATIEKVETVTVVAATSLGSAALNVGLQRLDRTTEYDYDGIIAAAAMTTIDAINETNTYTVVSGAGGAVLGVQTTNPAYLTADWDVAAFTAGKIRVKIYYRMTANVLGAANA